MVVPCALCSAASIAAASGAAALVSSFVIDQADHDPGNQDVKHGTYRELPMMPIGISRCGFFASWAAVETASKPIYAKKMTAAPVTTPLKPYGMNSAQPG